MTLKCVVAMVKSIKAGEGVSYGHTWTAPRDTNLALLPVGYADGVYRALGGRMDVPSMDVVTEAWAGSAWTSSSWQTWGRAAPMWWRDEAILFGPGDSGEPTAQDWADLMGTIHYEVVTSPRVRVALYLRGRPEWLTA